MSFVCRSPARLRAGFARGGSSPALKEKHNQKIAFFF